MFAGERRFSFHQALGDKAVLVFFKKHLKVFLLFLTENWVAQTGRGLVFSADFLYNGDG